MKQFIAFCIFTLIASHSHSQEKALENFNKELNLYLDFVMGKCDSIPVNAANQVKFRKKVDEAFRTFVLDSNSYNYPQFVQAKNDPTTKFLRPDGRIYIHLKTFLVNTKTYVVYSYSSRDKKNYCIKEKESNTIVYEGNSTCCYINKLDIIDNTHFLLIEESGDHHSSRSVFVLSGIKKPWSKLKAFEGKAFGQVPGEYTATKYVKKRDVFQLEYDPEYQLSAPEDVNTILFDPKTKVISYKQYTDHTKFKLITAKWENEQFIIDDYYVTGNTSNY